MSSQPITAEHIDSAAHVSAGGAARGLPPRRRRRRRSAERWGATVLTGPYVVLLVIAGVMPTLYAVYLSLRNSKTGEWGLQNFATAIGDFRFYQTFAHVGVTILVFVPIMIVGVVGLALLLHGTLGRLGSVSRFVYYIPGAFAGIANFTLWLFILDPNFSPIGGLLEAMGFSTLNEVITPSHMPYVLSAMLFFQGAGTWILIMYGGLISIPQEVTEAASIDGASAWRTALHIKLPLIMPWIAYAALLNVAYTLQLFLEPQVLSQATHGTISPQWSPNQLTFTYAYQIGNIGAASALSVILLLLTLVIGVIIVFRSGLFDDER